MPGELYGFTTSNYMLEHFVVKDASENAKNDANTL